MRGEEKRTRKRRQQRNKGEIAAFRHGVEVGREIVGEMSLKRAVRNGLAWGFGVGAVLATVATYLVLR